MDDNRYGAVRGFDPGDFDCSRVRDCGALMNRIQKLDFALVETALYLDSYPDSCEALKYYSLLLEKRGEAAKAYEAQCGPLTASGVACSGGWSWADGPWPWEACFPGNDACGK